MTINCKTETIRVSGITEQDRVALIAAGYKNTEQIGVADNEIWVRRTNANEKVQIML